MTICEPKSCLACSACANVCPHDAIKLMENQYGELCAVIDEGLCHKCGLCFMTCPVNARYRYRRPDYCYAAWTSDKSRRAKCASGGIATAFAEHVIVSKRGTVAGTAYDNHLIPHVVIAETTAQAEQFKGSKYVQSIVSRTILREIKKHLDSGRFVLYIGTPCQTAGLLSFLHGTRNNLITVDLLCHGTPPTRYFKEEVETLCRQHGLKDISNVRFRGNDDDNSRRTLLDRFFGVSYSNNFRFSMWKRSVCGDEILVYRGEPDTNYYMAGFLMGITLREACYNCKFARPERISDITLGDFINLGRKQSFPHDKTNVSVVLVNTNKGARFFRDFLETDKSIVAIERDFSERLDYPYSIVRPFPRHFLNHRFRRLYLKNGYSKAIEKTFRGWLFMKRIFGKLHHFANLPVYAVDKIKKRMMRVGAQIKSSSRNLKTKEPR